MVAGDLATRLRRFEAMAIVQQVEAATQRRMLIDPRLHPVRCRLFHRMVVAVVLVAVVVVVPSDVKTFAN